MTHVALERHAAWQVSSGGAVAAARERPPAPAAAFVGAWRRDTPPQLGDYDRAQQQHAAHRAAQGRLGQRRKRCSRSAASSRSASERV